MSKVLGIDPGQKTGFALYIDGALSELRTINPTQIKDAIESVSPDRVIFEDSRLQSATFARGVSPAAMRKIARNVGMVDGLCAQIVAICESINTPAHGISPRGKGAKLNAAEFQMLTGWKEKSNQHERDAGQVAYRFRKAAA